MSNKNPHEIADMLTACSANMQNEYHLIKEKIAEENRAAEMYEKEDRELMAQIAAKDHAIAEMEAQIRELDLEQEEHETKLEMQLEINEALYKLYEAQEAVEKGFDEYFRIDKEKAAALEAEEKEELKKIEERMKELDLKEAEYVHKIKALRASFEADSAHLEKEYKNLQGKVDQINGEMEDIAIANQKLNSNLEALLAENAEFDRATEASETKIAQVDQQLKLKGAEKANVKTHLDAIMKRIAELEANSEGHKAMNAHLKQERAKQEAKAKELKDNQDNFKKEIADAEAQLQAQVAKCDGLKQRLEANITNQIPQKFQELQESTSTAKMALQELRNQVASFPSEEQMRIDIDKQEESIKLCEAELAKYQNEIVQHQTNQSDENLSANHEAILEEIQQLKNKILTTQENVTKEEKQVDALEKEFEEMSKQLEELEQRVTTEEKECEKRQEINRKDESCKERYVQLVSENEVLEKDISRVQKEMMDYDQIRNEAMDKCQKKNSENLDTIKREIEKVDQQIALQKKKLVEKQQAQKAVEQQQAQKNVEPEKPQPSKKSSTVARTPQVQQKRRGRTLLSPPDASSKAKKNAQPKALPPKSPRALSALSLWSSSDED